MKGLYSPHESSRFNVSGHDAGVSRSRYMGKEAKTPAEAGVFLLKE